MTKEENLLFRSLLSDLDAHFILLEINVGQLEISTDADNRKALQKKLRAIYKGLQDAFYMKDKP